MARAGTGLIDRLAHGRALARWTRAAEAAGTLELDELRTLRGRARALQRQLGRVVGVAEERLALPLLGSNAIRAPVHSDWSWRPDPWRAPVRPHGLASVASGSDFGGAIKLFHDCPLAENTLRQTRNSRDTDLAPFGLRLDVFRFEGTFLSIVIDLPPEATRGLTRRHLLRLDPVLEFERPLEAFARLSLRHGPNTERLVREIDMTRPEKEVEFDLGYSNLNERRIGEAWVELIFERPGLNQITLRDLTLSRRPRAAL